MKQIKHLVLIALFAALIAVGAFLRIPVPVVPFTLQYLFVMLAGLLLGSRDGAWSVVGYIVIGLLGLPVFAGGGGFSYVLQPTFGYLIGFAVAAAWIGAMTRQPSAGFGRLLRANLLGLIPVYGLGMLYYWLIYTFYVGTSIGFSTLFLYCFVLAVPGDIVLCILAALLARRLIPVVRKECYAAH